MQRTYVGDTMDMSGIDKWLEPDETLDLNNCDREPIHIPGRIQPQGALLALAGEEVVLVSENIEDVLGTQDLEALSELLREHDLLSWQGQNNAERLIHGVPTHVMMHRVEGLRVLEFEPAQPVETSVMLNVLNTLSQDLNHTETTADAYRVLVDCVRGLIGFDRALAYVFDRDGHGSVVAESRVPHIESFLDLRFPGTDIPKQARKLYTLELTRHIADVDYEPVGLLPDINPKTQRPLNMTFSKLRSVSPIHIQYLQNMGVKASFSVSIVIHGELVAMIACHHNTPKHLDFRVRQTCELLGRMISGHFELKNEREQRRKRNEQLSAQVDLLCELGEQQTLDPTSDAWERALSFVDAESMFVLADQEHHRFGQPHPDEARLVALIQRMCTQDPHATHHSTEIAEQDPELQEGGGLLVIPVGTQGALAWFRAPEAKLIKWGGKPPTTEELNSLHPRHSFNQWQQNVQGTSREWSGADLEMAEILRRGLSARFDDTEVVGDSFERAMQQMREYVLHLEESNQALHRVNDDLRQFAYAASHDMRAPLRTIRSFFPLVKRQVSKDASDNIRSWVNYVENAADTLHRLQEGLWAFSRVNRVTEVDDIDLDALIKRVTLALASSLEGASIQVSEMPTLRGVSNQIETLFRNLLDNAAKYQSPDRPLSVLIDAHKQQNNWVISVTDNGIGFPPSEHQRIFDIFSRVHVGETDGDGLGLALCRRIVHHHQGWIRASSQPGQGSTFEFCIKEPRFAPS